MALVSRRRHQEEEEESIFVSMSDLMISILFIVMILMAFFARARSDDDMISLETHEKVVADLEGRLAVQEELVATLLAENSELRAELEKLQLEEKELREELAEARSKVANLTSQNERLGQENEELRVRLADLEAIVGDTKDLPEVLRVLREENSRLRGIIADLETRIADLQKEIERLRNLEDVRLSTALQNISEARRDLLQSIQMQLSQSGINVQVDPVSGVIRFDESVIRFGSGSYTPSDEVEAIMRTVADILDREIQCYTLGPQSSIARSCNEHLAIIEAIQIEGHTDDVPMRSRTNMEDNLDLSAKRAASTYRIFKEHKPDLTFYQNANYIVDDQRVAEGLYGQPVLSVSGYGSSRPVKGNSREERDANRRIDLRFIMTTPKSTTEADKLFDTVAKAVQDLAKL